MSEGQPYATYEDMLVLGWNDLQLVEQAFRDHGDDIAGILTEPISCNCGIVDPVPGYLEGLRAICDRYGAVLIFDEVQTGFRVALGGAQAVHRVSPDLTCLGKAVSGGLPVSVLGGRRDVMQLITDRRVFQAGTYNGNPLCLAAIPVVIERMSRTGTYERMTELSHRLRRGLSELVAPLGGYVQGTNTLFGLGFGPGPVRNMRDGWRNDPERMLAFKQALWSVGIYTKPTPRDIWYLSTEHSQADIDITLERAAEAASIAAALPEFDLE
jgi:glutamate-1-semialdehyde 2,1-aminomutase